MINRQSPFKRLPPSISLLIDRVYGPSKPTTHLNAASGPLYLVYCETYPNGCIMSKSALLAYKRKNGHSEAITAAKLDAEVAVELAKTRGMPRLDV